MQRNLAPKVGDDQEISGIVIEACNVSLTSEIQLPAEERRRSYKMEIEGESLQSSCQEALS
jgi:hypothetical protein